MRNMSGARKKNKVEHSMKSSDKVVLVTVY